MINEETIETIRTILGDKSHISLTTEQLFIGNIDKISKKNIKAIKLALVDVLGENLEHDFREDDETFTIQSTMLNEPEPEPEEEPEPEPQPE